MADDVNVIEAKIDIDAPPEAVWNVIMDPDRFGDWVTIHRRVGRVSDEPLTVGSTLEQRLCLHGVPFDVTWTLERCDHPRHAEFSGRGPARSRAAIENQLDPRDGGGTRFTYRNKFEPPGGLVGRVASRVLVGGASQREANASLQRLKALLENGSG